MNAVTLKVEGMHCGGCAAIIQALLERNSGVRKASASYEAGEARVVYDPQTITDEQLTAVIEQAGYRVAGRSAG